MIFSYDLFCAHTALLETARDKEIEFSGGAKTAQKQLLVLLDGISKFKIWRVSAKLKGRHRLISRQNITLALMNAYLEIF